MDDLTSSLLDAAQNSDFDRVILLIEQGADIDAQDGDGWTTLMYASRNANVVNVLVNRGANINIKDRDGWTALMFASMAGNCEAFDLLLKNGADIHAVDDEGKTSLDIAEEYGQHHIIEFIKGYFEKQALLPLIDGLDDLNDSHGELFL